MISLFFILFACISSKNVNAFEFLEEMEDFEDTNFFVTGYKKSKEIHTVSKDIYTWLRGARLNLLDNKTTFPQGFIGMKVHYASSLIK